MEVLRKAVVDAGGVPVVAAAAGIAPSHLYGVCNGHKPLTAGTMRKLKPHVALSNDAWVALLDGGSEATDAA